MVRAPVSGACACLVCAHECRPARVVSAQHDEIGRDALVCRDAYQVAHQDVLRLDRLRLASRKQPLVGLLVDGHVSTPALHVVVRLLGHGDGEDEDERRDVCEQQPDLQRREELRERDEQIVQIEKVAELLK